ncbi:beta-2 adrenergic receptor [Scaptodrosophila lebanonensis]|uniref:Beta-2 adrenergic receptor n=1 Tax=Drosophila lebanonensis TaxID=7225 RepID=A0A6J2TJS5_DROLE|nr:beta-2 adrenergic receptor [Scaptodrosophila lebanonensis]
MAVHLQSQLHNLSVIQPSLMYVAASSLASSGVIGLQENISIVYEDFLESSNNIVNRALLPTTAAATTTASTAAVTSTTTTVLTLTSTSTANDTSHDVSGSMGGIGGIAVPATTNFSSYYNESATAAEWAHFYDLIFIFISSLFIVITIIGNTLVILAVITTRRLKTVTNCFVMSLAVADLLVGIFVMPPAVAVHLIGSWQLGWVLCDIWISLDVLLCTASILSLCAISVDRYLAVTRPLTYSRKRRSKRLALIMILIVWLLALAITCPPMLGWYEPGRRDLRECRYNQNEGYVIFSAMGSFFIPMAVMIYVYARISCVIASRHDNMTDISVHNKKFKRYTAADVENDIDHDFSEQEHSSGQKNKQAAARTFSNQTIAKELHEIMLSEGENCGGAQPGTASLGLATTAGGLNAGATHCHSLLALPSPQGAHGGGKNGCYELTRPSSLKRTATASTTMTTMTSGVGAGSSLLDAQWQSQQQQSQQPQQQPRAHSFRHSHLSVGAQGDRLRGHHHHHFVATGTGAQSSSSGHAKSLSNRVTLLKKENKTTQTLSIVVGGFIACWLPFFVYYLITPFLGDHQVSTTLTQALTWLGWFNSAINPFIYAFYSVDFRAAFWRLTCKRFFSSAQKPQFPTNTMSIRR